MKRTWITTAALALLVGTSLAAGPNRTPVAAVTAGSVDPVGGSLAPKPYEREVAAIVADMLQTYHYEKRDLDDEISRRWFDGYLENLDYQRMVFLAADIEEFSAHRTSLDDELLSHPPKLETAMTIHARYRQRMRERAEYARSLLKAPLDLANDETLVPDRHEADLPWPATPAEADELWRKRIEDEVIENLMTGRDTESEIRERLAKRYDRMLRALDDTESTDVLELWLDALTQSYDPHSLWLKPANNDNFDIDITNSVEGIGASLSQSDDYTTVVEVIAGGPAFKSGRVFKEDRILMVGQGSEEPVDVVGMRLDKVVKLIRGTKGTKVTLHIEHADGNHEVVVLERDRVILEDGSAEASVEASEGHKLGVVRLPSFYVDPNNRKGGRRASQDVKRALQKLEADGVEGVILDLRHNGGGSLTEAFDVAGLFLPGGPVVQVRDRDGRIEALHDRDSSVSWAGPMVVLTDATSASASEIVAGALQDYGRAVIVGDERTHGKGTVQQVAPLTQQLRGQYEDDVGGALKLTVQKFYRVSGGSTQEKGVSADVVFPSEWDGVKIHESDLEHALSWDRIPPAPHVRTGDLARVVPELSSRSAKRRAADEDFQKLTARVEERKSLEDKPVSLVLEQRRSEYEARKARLGIEDAPTPEEAAAMTEEERDAKIRAQDFVLDEALRVLADLISLG